MPDIIPTMTDEDVGRVQALEDAIGQLPQISIQTDHMIHGGMYVRTVYIPEGMVFTSVLVKIPTVVMISGDVTVFLGGGSERLTGYNVMAASALRKQAFVTHADTVISMTFPTQAQTVEEAEREFTDHVDDLASHRTDRNNVLITGEQKCLA